MSNDFKGKSPDLVFYVNRENSRLQTQEVGFIINRQFTRPIFSDEECKNVIGSMGGAETLETNDNDSSVTSLFLDLSISFFNLGGFIAQGSNNKYQINTSTNYNGEYVYPKQLALTLTSGNGDFINATGNVVIFVNSSSVRKYLVYFTHI